MGILLCDVKIRREFLSLKNKIIRKNNKITELQQN